MDEEDRQKLPPALHQLGPEVPPIVSRRRVKPSYVQPLHLELGNELQS